MGCTCICSIYGMYKLYIWGMYMFYMGWIHFVWYSMWDGFFSPRVFESHATSVLFGDKYFLAYYYFTSQGTLVMLNTLRKVEDHENHVRWINRTTVLYMGESQKYARSACYIWGYMLYMWCIRYMCGVSVSLKYLDSSVIIPRSCVNRVFRTTMLTSR